MNSLDRRQLLKTVPPLAFAAALGCGVSSGAALGGSRRRIKAGQIGTTHAHAAGKMAALRKFGELYEVVGVVEPDEQRWAAVKDTPDYQGVLRLREDELLAAPGLELVAVETVVRDLVPTAARCIAADKHVHLDKPGGESLDDFQKLLDEAARRKRTVQMGYMFRYNPAFMFLFQAVRDGWLGEIFEVHGVMSKAVDDATRTRLAEYRGGSMFELGCHLIDALCVVLGEPKSVTPYTRRTRDADDLADNQLAVFEFENATATIRSSLVEIDGGRRRQFVVCGTHGSIEIEPLEPPKLVLTLDRPRGEFKVGTQEVKLTIPEGRYDGDFLDLAKIVRGEKKSDYAPSHDLAVHRAILRASDVPLN